MSWGSGTGLKCFSETSYGQVKPTLTTFRAMHAVVSLLFIRKIGVGVLGGLGLSFAKNELTATRMIGVSGAAEELRMGFLKVWI